MYQLTMGSERERECLFERDKEGREKREIKRTLEGKRAVKGLIK